MKFRLNHGEGSCGCRHKLGAPFYAIMFEFLAKHAAIGGMLIRTSGLFVKAGVFTLFLLQCRVY